MIDTIASSIIKNYEKNYVTKEKMYQFQVAKYMLEKYLGYLFKDIEIDLNKFTGSEYKHDENHSYEFKVFENNGGFSVVALENGRNVFGISLSKKNVDSETLTLVETNYKDVDFEETTTTVIDPVWNDHKRTIIKQRSGDEIIARSFENCGCLAPRGETTIYIQGIIDPVTNDVHYAGMSPLSIKYFLTSIFAKSKAEREAARNALNALENDNDKMEIPICSENSEKAELSNELSSIENMLDESDRPRKLGYDKFEVKDASVLKERYGVVKGKLKEIELEEIKININLLFREFYSKMSNAWKYKKDQEDEMRHVL